MLIGSGEGTLTIPEAVAGSSQGIRDAVDESRPARSCASSPPSRKLMIVEPIAVGRRRSSSAQDGRSTELTTRLEQPPRVAIAAEAEAPTGPAGRVSVEEASRCCSVGSRQDRRGRPGRRAPRARGSTARRDLRRSGRCESFALTARRAAGSKPRARGPARRFAGRDVAPDPGAADCGPRVFLGRRPDDPSRRDHAGGDRSGARHRRRPGLVDELVEQMTDPLAGHGRRLCRLLYRLLVPPEFRELCGRARSSSRSTGRWRGSTGRSSPAPRRRRSSEADRREHAGRPADPHGVQPVADAAAASARGASRPRDRRPRRPGEAARPPGRPARGAARREILKERGGRSDGADRCAGDPADGTSADVPPGRSARGARAVARGRVRHRPLRGSRGLRPAGPRRAGWLFASGLLTGSRDRAHRAGAGDRRRERVPLGPNSQALAGGRAAATAPARRRCCRASRTSSSTSASATTSDRVGGERHRRGAVRRALLRGAAAARGGTGDSVRRSRADGARALWEKRETTSARSGPPTSTTAIRRATPASRAAEPRTSDKRQRGANAPALPAFSRGGCRVKLLGGIRGR